jgi:molybdate transport system substrate-binding protein
MILRHTAPSKIPGGPLIAVCALLLAILQAVSPPVAQAAEIKVIAVPTFNRAFKEIVPRFESATGHTLVVNLAVLAPLMRRIDSGEKFDVAIIRAQEIDSLIGRGRLLADTRVSVARVGIGVWVRPGAPKRDISSVEAFKRLLIDAKSISYTRESGAGVYIAGLIERLGLADTMKPKTTLFGDGGQNQNAVAAGEVEYGFSVASDGAGRSDVELLGLLPPEIQYWVTFVAGAATDARDPASTQSFLKFMVSPEVRLVLKANALEPESR